MLRFRLGHIDNVSLFYCLDIFKLDQFRFLTRTSHVSLVTGIILLSDFDIFYSDFDIFYSIISYPHTRGLFFEFMTHEQRCFTLSEFVTQPDSAEDHITLLLDTYDFSEDDLIDIRCIFTPGEYYWDDIKHNANTFLNHPKVADILIYF